MSTPNFQAGDPVLYQSLNPNRKAREGYIVERVARVWGFARGPHSQGVKFRVEDGYEDGRGYTPPGRILTPQMLADEERREAAVDALRALGISSFQFGQFSTDALISVIETLRADREDDQ